MNFRAAIARPLMLAGAFTSLVWAFSSAEPFNSIRFRNISSSSGIHAEMRCGGPEKKWIPEANGSGVAWLDFDQDGKLDLLIVNGSTIDSLREILKGKTPAARPGSVYLYRNLGGGLFEDVTSHSGLSNPYWGTGVAVADFDNDGFPDILITNIGRDLLYRNNGNGTFTDVSSHAGLSQTIAWHTGAAFGDYDGDGHLDFYVAGYVSVSELQLDKPAPVCLYRNLPVFCGPKGLKGETDILYRGNGNGTFADVTKASGVEDKDLRHGFTVVFDDFNHDGKIDLFVANDSDPNYLYLNQGNGTFKEAGLSSGVAFNGDGQTQANMGVAVGDYNNDGLVDVLTTTFSEDYFPLFKSQAPGAFEDVTAAVGLWTSTTSWLGWSCGFVDFNNDGHKDLWLANGHVYPNADSLPRTTYSQPIVVFRNENDRFVPVPGVSGNAGPHSYRGGAAADFNNNGKIGLLVLPISGEPVLLENMSDSPAHWIGFALHRRTTNRDAIGAQVQLDYCGKTQFDSVRNGGGYLSVNDPRLHFGLGSCSAVTSLTIAWPDGKRQIVRRMPVDRYVTIEEPL